MGRATFPSSCGVRLQCRRQIQSLVLSILSLVRPLHFFYLRRFSSRVIFGFRGGVVVRSRPSPPDGGLRMERNDRAPLRLFLTGLSHGLLSPYRIHRELVSRARARVSFRGAERTLVARRSARGFFVDDTRKRNCFVADPCRRGLAAMVHHQALALAMALDRGRSCRIRGLSFSELEDFRQSFRVSRDAKTTLPHDVVLAMGGNHGCFSKFKA